MTYTEYQDIAELLTDARYKALNNKDKKEAKIIIEIEEKLASLVKGKNPMQVHND